LAEDNISEEEEELKERYGNYSIHDRDYKLNRLNTISFDSNLVLNEQITFRKDSINTVLHKAAQITTHLTKTTFSINNLAWKPDSNQIIITHQPNPNVTSFLESDISIYDLESQELKTIVKNKSVDSFITWSPDGQAFMYLTSIDNDSTNFILNDRYFIYDMVSNSSKEVASSFDENLQNITWMNGGIFATAYQKSTQPIIQINPTTGTVDKVIKDKRLISDISVSQSGSEMALVTSYMYHFRLHIILQININVVMKKSFVEKLSGNEKEQINLFRETILANDSAVIETVDKIMTVDNTLNYMQDGVFKYGLAKTDNHYSLHSMVMYAYPELGDWLKSKKLKIKILKGCINFEDLDLFPLKVLEEFISLSAEKDFVPIVKKYKK